jgi:hypothetical protein
MPMSTKRKELEETIGMMRRQMVPSRTCSLLMSRLRLGPNATLGSSALLYASSASHDVTSSASHFDPDNYGPTSGYQQLLNTHVCCNLGSSWFLCTATSLCMIEIRFLVDQHSKLVPLRKIE